MKRLHQSALQFHQTMAIAPDSTSAMVCFLSVSFQRKRQGDRQHPD
ncbi:MAG: hypothetical protein H7Z11_07100 [Verrucomicrobia bacterium]|nr:hypothetical protein [Leptolyngbya sp. ES-bin-22]